MQESLCSQSGATRPKARWETQGGPTRYNGSICRLRDWHRGSHPICWKQGRNKSTFHPSNRDNKPNLQINHDNNKMLTQTLFKLTMSSQNSANWKRCRTRKRAQYKSDREFWDLSRKYKYALIWPTVQELSSLEVGEGVNFGQIKLSGPIWTLTLIPKEIWENSKYQNPRDFHNLPNDG
jgi:hypothetical protein